MPTARPTHMERRLRSAASLPSLVWQVARWGPLRGGWFPGYLRSHRAFDVEAIHAYVIARGNEDYADAAAKGK